MTIPTLRATAVLAALLSAACATAPAAGPAPAPQAAQPAAFDAAGTYEFTGQFRGQSFDGVIRLASTQPGAYTGTFSTTMTGEMPVRSVEVRGTRVRVTAQGRLGDAVVNLDVNGRAFTGGWTYGPSAGDLTGRVRS